MLCTRFAGAPAPHVCERWSFPPTMRLPRRRLAAALTLILSFAMGGAGTQAQQAPPPAVTVAPVKKLAIAPTVQRVGQTQAVEDVSLRARVQGFLVERLFEEGSDVKRGDLLFVIEREPYEAEVQRREAELARSQAALENAQLALERAEELRKRGNVSQQRLDDAIAAERQASADVLTDRAELRIARINLGYTEIRAPVDGRVGRSRYSIGDLVGPESDVLTTLVTLDPIYVYWGVSEEILLRVRKEIRERETRGEARRIVVPRIQFRDGSLYEHEGLIDFLDNRVDRSTGTQTVRAVFANPDKLLLPGQYISIALQLGEEQDRLVVPQVAVQDDQGGRYVLVVNDQNEVTVRRVTLGVRQGVYWVVESGLTEGEWVIWQGVQKVRPGIKVETMVATPDPAVTE